MAARRKRILTKLRIDELAAVDNPAMEGARALLLKRDEGAGDGEGDGVRKDYDDTPAVMTSNEAGHAHLVYLRGRGGETSYSKSEGSESGHDHPWLLQPDGRLLIGESEGHSHEVPTEMVLAALVVGKSGGTDPTKATGAPPVRKEDDMAGTTPKAPTPEALASENAELKEKLARAEAVASLTDPQRQHFAKLAEADQGAFLKLDSSGRDAAVAAAVAKAAETDPVLYTDRAGVTYRRSDGDKVIALAKRADESEKRAEDAESSATTADLQKRAASLEYLPGDEDVKVEMLRAIDGIKDPAVRKASLESLAAQNAELSKAFQVLGRRGGESPGSGSPEAKLDELAKGLKAADPKLTDEAAMAKALETPEGRKAYADSVGPIN